VSRPRAPVDRQTNSQRQAVMPLASQPHFADRNFLF